MTVEKITTFKTLGLQRELTDATKIDRLNLGPIPTTKLDWLQPHEGNIVDFLFRARALQMPKEKIDSKS